MNISVIMPCRNGERYLAAAIESVVSQSIDGLELILINDASTDSTREIMEHFAETYPWIRVLDGKGQGVSAARNAGLDVASGEWIFFMDADDILPENALRSLLEETDTDAEIIIGAHATFDENGSVPVWPDSDWPKLTGAEKKRKMLLRLIEGDEVLNIMCNKLHRRTHLSEYGIRLKENLRLAEDNLFNLEAVLTAKECRYRHQITYLYRMHAASTMGKVTGSTFDQHRDWLIALKEVLIRYDVFADYYSAYVDSVVLRLYKDGGIPEVLRSFESKAKQLVLAPEEQIEKMSGKDQKLARRIRSGAFLKTYVFRASAQIAQRKWNEFMFSMRKNREREALINESTGDNQRHHPVL
ncbi:MAG: glycosyltransferase [Clostridia bacterium]|nr:glycosyltransferase [Clostridia bacterium]